MAFRLKLSDDFERNRPVVIRPRRFNVMKEVILPVLGGIAIAVLLALAWPDIQQLFDRS